MQALITKSGGQVVIENIPIPQIHEGEVLIKSVYSSLNYKDALGVTGKGKIYKQMPMIGGIDVAGEISDTKHPRFKIGDKVLITGCGLGEIFAGGYSEYVKFSGDNVILLPAQLTLKEAMIYGTAGFTAALCLARMKTNGQTPQKGPIVVTGASGGVGVFAISFLAKLGFRVIAVSGKRDHRDYLISLGANEVLSSEELGLGDRPLEKARFGGAIDNVGGDVLAKLMSHIDLYGNIACVGLAESAHLKTTVMPMILRGVSLLGISSNNCEINLRQQLWSQMANELKPKNLEVFLQHEIGLQDVLAWSKKMLARQTFGRTVVKCEN